jgi:class 3 adenylate cyclase
MNVVHSRFKISISVGISAAFFIVIFAITLALGGSILFNLRDTMRTELQKKMDAILRVASLNVDASQLPAITDPSQETGAPYAAIKKQLQAIRDKVKDIRFVYTMRQNAAGKVEFVVDAETDAKTMSHVGDVYDAPTPTLLKAFNGNVGDTFVEREPSPDEWGVWLSGFLVLDKPNGSADLLGIDISAKTIFDSENRALGIMAAVALGVSLVVLLLGLVLSRRITLPLRAIEADMARIQKFQIEGQTGIKTVFKEIRLMNEAVDDMKKSLRAFKRYVPSDLVAELITLHKEARLGGERRHLTVFFSDIEGFTTWSESLEPEQLIQLMARYFSGMTEIILRHKGTVDKYIGDAIMAFWGAPAELEDHAVRACLAALECQKFQTQFNEEIQNEGFPPVYTRIGLNTGDVLVGNVGYEERLNYTVIGDHVNLASRLEGLNKLYQTKIIISQHTQELLADQCLTRPIDYVIVKGKSEPIGVYELLATNGVSDKHRSYAELSAKAFAFYRDRQWDQALTAYERLLQARPHDGPASVMAERCRKYIADPPGADWQGAIILRDK